MDDKAVTTPERVREILDEDETLTDEQRTALAELFEAAYSQLTTMAEGEYLGFAKLALLRIPT